MDRPDGVVTGVNLKRINEMPYFLCTNVPRNVAVVTANQSSPPIPMSVSGEGPAMVHGLSAHRFPTAPAVYPNVTSIARVFLQIQDGGQMRGLMNAACHIDTIFGNYLSGNKSYPLPEALYIDETRALHAIITDISGVQNNVRLVAETQRMLTRIPDHNLTRARDRMEKRQYLSMPYFYALDNAFTVLAGGGTNTESITISRDHHFELFQITAVSTGEFSMNIINQTVGESLIDAPQGTNYALSSRLLTGSASFPFRFHEPRFLELGSKLIVTLTDLSGAPNTVYLTLGGRAIADRLWS
jgi:hypothetical protein